MKTNINKKVKKIMIRWLSDKKKFIKIIVYDDGSEEQKEVNAQENEKYSTFS